MRLILRQTDSNLSQYQNFHQFTSTLGYRNISHLPSDTGTVHIYPRIQEQFTFTLGYRNSLHLPSDTGTVYIYPLFAGTLRKYRGIIQLSFQNKTIIVPDLTKFQIGTKNHRFISCSMQWRSDQTICEKLLLFCVKFDRFNEQNQ